MIIGMAFAWDRERIVADETYQALERCLLAIGGKHLVYMPAPPRLIEHVIEQGQVFTCGAVKCIKGEASHCHENVEALWKRSPGRYRRCFGYGLSPDGLWRQHSWLLLKDATIIETTVPRRVYFGVINGQDKTVGV